ncbi:hypothetical protein AMAG_18959 [Allomyces macrogynus ATCC 38327]|uniref:Uncharacterized protein n=1 Tax=Allomyces macrogynus (strain ATCC 38327) TaxID=578462 RepID=A0A0L0SLA0_ALLM3|nr:hypothetical protein AMAG_18959 [Allomyces macrogynus ATCC 38327]|eukprot:KNE63164.1 hypothetical protein AMAG_18959 [Allomyces macrogynus ATCC 38327]
MMDSPPPPAACSGSTTSSAGGPPANPAPVGLVVTNDRFNLIWRSQHNLCLRTSGEACVAPVSPLAAWKHDLASLAADANPGTTLAPHAALLADVTTSPSGAVRSAGGAYLGVALDGSDATARARAFAWADQVAKMQARGDWVAERAAHPAAPTAWTLSSVVSTIAALVALAEPADVVVVVAAARRSSPTLSRNRPPTELYLPLATASAAATAMADGKSAPDPTQGAHAVYGAKCVPLADGYMVVMEHVRVVPLGATALADDPRPPTRSVAAPPPPPADETAADAYWPANAPANAPAHDWHHHHHHHHHHYPGPSHAPPPPAVDYGHYHHAPPPSWGWDAGYPLTPNGAGPPTPYGAPPPPPAAADWQTWYRDAPAWHAHDAPPPPPPVPPPADPTAADPTATRRKRARIRHPADAFTTCCRC